MSEPHEAIRIGVREFRANLAGYLRQARRGSSFVVVSHGEVVAQLLPPPSMPVRREPGRLKGRIALAPDFDATPEEVIAAMEGRNMGEDGA